MKACIWPLLNDRFWSWILHEADAVKKKHQRYKDVISIAKPLPENYRQAMLNLDGLLSAFMSTIGLFMRASYMHVFGTFNSCDEQAIMSGASRVLYQKDPLAWCFRMLTSDLRDNPSPQIVLGELDRLLELDPAQNERFDQTLRSLLSNLAICWRMHEMLRFHRPSYQPQNM